MLQFGISGGGWGLGCNSIHFLDLIGWLTGATTVELSGEWIDADTVRSKRPGFVEFTGGLHGRCGDARIELASYRDSMARILVSIRGESRSCVVDETAGRAHLLDSREPDAGWSTLDFSMPLISDLLSPIAAIRSFSAWSRRAVASAS